MNPKNLSTGLSIKGKKVLNKFISKLLNFINYDIILKNNRYYSPGYSEQLLERIEQYQPQI